ncbi:MAG: hypothetical protein HC933_09605 [Pleurocapsa sp. SU_196_0]|nr:hypothetical protein [Pleurocapsa sp. SU_196_0]
MKRIQSLIVVILALLVGCSQELVARGELIVETLGLTQGTTTTVTVRGPNNFEQQLELRGEEISALPKILAGEYTVSVLAVSGLRSPATQTVTLGNRDSRIVSLRFTVPQGKLEVNVTGLSPNDSTTVTVRGPLPATTDRTLNFPTNSLQSLETLEAGRYEVIPGALAGYFNPSTQTVEVTDGNTTRAEVAYIRFGQLRVRTEGIAAQLFVQGNLRVTGPNGFTLEAPTVSGAGNTVAIDNAELLPGRYTLTVTRFPSGHDLLGIVVTNTAEPFDAATSSIAFDVVSARETEVVASFEVPQP